MNEVIKKISEYQLFNNWFPGISLLVIMKCIFKYNIDITNLIIIFPISYLIGIFINRFGSLLIESALYKLKVLEKVEYKKYIFAKSKDEDIKMLLQERNLYRTLLSLLIIILLLFIIDLFEINNIIKLILFLILLIVLMYKAFIKQNKYLIDRINHYDNIKEKNTKKIV